MGSWFRLIHRLFQLQRVFHEFLVHILFPFPRSIYLPCFLKGRAPTRIKHALYFWLRLIRRVFQLQRAFHEFLEHVLFPFHRPVDLSSLPSKQTCTKPNRACILFLVTFKSLSISSVNSISWILLRACIFPFPWPIYLLCFLIRRAPNRVGREFNFLLCLNHRLFLNSKEHFVNFWSMYSYPVPDHLFLTLLQKHVHQPT